MIGSELTRRAARLRQEHLDAAFPAGLRGLEVDDIDVVLLDADTAGCVHTWIDNGALDPGRGRVLRTCVEDLDRAIP